MAAPSRPPEAGLPGRFKTFKPGERELAAEFIRSGLIPGEVRPGIPLESEKSRQVARENPQAGYWDRYPWMYKMDLVIEGPEEVWIVEIKEKIRMAALSQLLLYRSLYREQFPTEKPIRLALVARRDSPELRAVTEAQGVAVFLLPGG